MSSLDFPYYMNMVEHIWSTDTHGMSHSETPIRSKEDEKAVAIMRRCHFVIGFPSEKNQSIYNAGQ